MKFCRGFKRTKERLDTLEFEATDYTDSHGFNPCKSV